MTEAPETGAPQKEPILAPEEIDALMQAVAPGEQAHALLAMLPAIEQPKEVTDFDFSSVSESGPERYPLIYTLQQRMTEDLKEHWSEMFRREISISAEAIEQKTYHEILEETDVKQVYLVYVVDGFGRMLVTCDMPLIIAHVDAMLGGTGEVFGEGAEVLSPVENKLSLRVGHALAKHLTSMWKPVSPMNFVLEKIEVESQFLSVASGSDPCFSLVHNIKVAEDFRGDLKLHFPRTFLEPVLDSLRVGSSDEQTVKDAEWESLLQKSLEQVPLIVRLELGQCNINIKQFLALRSGDFLPLSKSESEPSTLWVSSSPMFEAMPGSQDGNLAAELTKQLAHD